MAGVGLFAILLREQVQVQISCFHQIRPGGLNLEQSGHGVDRAKLRRLTMNPPLSEAELAGFRAANPGLKIDREPSGVIIFRRKRRRSDEPVDCVMSGIDLRDEKRPTVGPKSLTSPRIQKLYKRLKHWKVGFSGSGKPSKARTRAR